MGVDGSLFLVIVRVGVLVAGRAIRVVRLIHAGAEVRVIEDLVLVIKIKAERVADFLAQNELPPRGGVVRCRVEIGIVHLGDTLRDVGATDPDLGDAQPTVDAILSIAHLNPPRGGLASPRCSPARDDRSVQHGGLGPVGRCDGEVGIPGG